MANKMIRRYQRCLLLIGMLMIGFHPLAIAETIDREYPLKSAYLFNIFKFITWPDFTSSTTQYLYLCIIGSDFSDAAIYELDDRQIDNIVIKVRNFSDVSNIDTCKALYFTGLSKQSDLDRLSKKGKLLIGEHEQFIAQGGTLNFFIEKNKLRFEINVNVANQAGIKISSKLLRLARIRNN